MSTTPPAKSRWSRRIGTAVRRVSSGLTPRPAAPPVDSSDFGSLKKTNIHVSPPLPPPHPPETSAPIEFPTREGPFINDTGYARPRLTDSSTSLGSGTFTDELDDLPQPVNIEPPANCSPSSSASQIFATPSPLVAETPMVPSQVTGPLECKTEFGPRPAAEPEAECGPVRDREFLCRPVREAFAPGSVREVEREAVHEPVMKGHGPPCLTRGNTISDTTPSTPVDEYIPLALNSPTAGPGEADSQSIEHKHSSSSLKQFTTAPANLSLPSSTNQHSVIPSPIAESPAHEAAASQEDHAPIGLSSLAQGTVVRNAASANEYTPPPLLDSSAVGPRGFTDEPDDLPQPLAAVGPARSHPPSIHERESAAEGAQADTTEPQPQAAAPQVEAPTPQTEPPAPQAEASALQVVAPAPQADLLQPMAFIGPARPSPSSTHEESQVAAPNAPNKPTTPQAEPRMRSNPEVWGDAVPLLQTPERKAGEVIIPNNGDASDQSRAPSIHVPHEDPFVDPSHPSEPDPPILSIYEPVGGPLREEVPVTMMPIPASAQSVYGFGAGETPANQTHPGPPESVVYQQPPAYPDYGYVAMPPSEGMMPSHLLYPPGQGLSRRRVRPSQEPEQEKVGSGDGRTRVGWVVPFSRDSRTSDAYQRNPGETPDRAYNTTHGFETCDTPSLISPPSPSSGSSGYGSHLQSPGNPRHDISLLTGLPLSQDVRPFHAYGWVEYLLPDESLYYVHQGYRVVSDIDLSDEKLLDAVITYLENHSDVIPPGKELWLRDTGSREGGFAPFRWLVDHSKQSMTFDSSHEANGESHRLQHGGDDRLDVKYRYWSFMEAHPAHTSLPPGAHQDAMDALNWASTNGLIRSHPSRSTPAPFTREECQSLTALLQSIHKQGETPLRTHTVSKILLEVVCWRQSHFRPDKPLPVDAGRDGLRREDPMPVRSSSTFVLATGVHACLVAAIALCPSKTFAKVVGIGALLFSLSSSVVSNAVTVAQSKADSNGSIVLHARRAIPMFSDRIVVDSRPPSPLSWHRWLWRGLESRLNKALISGSSDTILKTAINSI